MHHILSKESRRAALVPSDPGVATANGFLDVEALVPRD